MILTQFILHVQSGGFSLKDENGIFIYFWPNWGSTYLLNQFSIGSDSSSNNAYNEIPLGSWCNGGTFKINS